MQTALAFKLAVHTDGTIGYEPKIDPDRDAALLESLEAHYQGYMRFKATSVSFCSAFLVLVSVKAKLIGDHCRAQSFIESFGRQSACNGQAYRVLVLQNE